MTPLTLETLLEASPIILARTAIVETLKALYPDVAVYAHPGRLDMADVLTVGLFPAPSIHVAAWRLRNDDRLSGDEDLPVHWRAYIFAESKQVGGLVYGGDEVGYALMQSLLDQLMDVDTPRWGLEEIGLPTDAEGEPVFTLKTYEKGTLVYVVTWRQTLYAVGRMAPNLGGDWSEDPAPAPPAPQNWIPGGLG